MVRLSRSIPLALLVTAMLASSAAAQLRGFRMPPSLENMGLLGMNAVQEELKVTPEQKTEITALTMQMRSEAMEIMSGLQDLTEKERQEELPNLMKLMNEKGKELQAKVDKILNPEQTARVKELSIQRRNAGALQDPEVLATLKLSGEQIQQLVDIRDSAAKEQEELVKTVLGGGGDQGQVREKIQALQKVLAEKALAVLTPDQREAFEKMKGAKFNFPQQRGFGF